MSVKITKSEWDDYYSTQRSGRMNMWSHPLIVKFAEDNNWRAAYEYFEVQKKTDDLIIEMISND